MANSAGSEPFGAEESVGAKTAVGTSNGPLGGLSDGKANEASPELDALNAFLIDVAPLLIAGLLVAGFLIYQFGRWYVNNGGFRTPDLELEDEAEAAAAADAEAQPQPASKVTNRPWQVQ